MRPVGGFSLLFVLATLKKKKIKYKYGHPAAKTRKKKGSGGGALMAYCVPLSIVYLLLAIMLADGVVASFAYV